MEKEGENVVERVTEDHFINKEGRRMFCKYWYPTEENANELRAIVFLCHGAGEHCQIYERIALPLTKQKIVVFAHDHVGHGKSEGDRVHINTIDTYVEDVMTHVNKTKKNYPDLPCFIVGHSMGGAIAVKTALDNPNIFAGIVLVGPAIVPNSETVTPFKVFLARVVARLMPQFPVGKLEPIWLSRDPIEVKRHEDDPLVYHGSIKAKWAMAMLTAMEEIQRRLLEIEWPFFIVHGKADKICSFEGSQLFYDKASSKDKLLKGYEGGYHQVHVEPEGQGDEVILDIVQWITMRAELSPYSKQKDRPKASL